MLITGKSGATIDYDDYFIGVAARPAIGDQKAGEIIATRIKDKVRISLGWFDSLPKAYAAWEDLEKAAHRDRKTYKIKKNYEPKEMDHTFGRKE